MATHTETGDKLVIYRGLYEDGPLWARPIDMFLSEMDPEVRKDYPQEYRFELIEIKSKRKSGH